ncbi:MAG TPA: hypothetical protein VM144_10520 [Aestuariivirga sp.]|nr:hypothetical protein [Aestuariivirga sp.]
MRIDLVHSDASPTDALDGLFSHNGGRLPLQRVLHEAAADVEEGLEFWKTIAGKIPPRRRVSREYLNRNG